MADVNAPKPAPRFYFRGNAMASGGYLTRLDGKPITLDPNVMTVHGESSLPTNGGVSHSVFDAPHLAFAPWITYGRCETRVQGLTAPDGTHTTTIFTTVSGVRVQTRPSPEDKVPEIRQIAVIATTVSLAVRSIHPPTGQQPQFFLAQAPVVDGLAIQISPVKGDLVTLPFQLVFDHPLMNGYTLDRFESEFTKDRQFFEKYGPGCHGPALKFGSKPPRSSSGYIVTSIVNGFKIGDKSYPGNVFTQPGFGTVTFGTLLADGGSRRLTLVDTLFGSDPAGSSSHGGADSNGVYGN
jgi:hypothetical protein